MCRAFNLRSDGRWDLEVEALRYTRGRFDNALRDRRFIVRQNETSIVIDKRPNMQMEPTRQMVCANVSLRRAAHLQR